MKPNIIIVTPKKNVIVKDPETLGQLPEKGKEVKNMSYWHRRARDGDVTITLPPQVTRGKNKKASSGNEK